jgi:hypothetical protein
VFDESRIPDAVRLLERRQASLWHACQLIDLAAYLRLGGIGSRAALERAGHWVPALPSDAADRQSGQWERVVCSLDDIGHGFAAGWGMTPNVFGPITLQLAPSVLTDATEAAFCLRSSTSPGFDPITDSLGDVSLVDELFWHRADAGFPRSTWLRFGDHLPQTFGMRDASAADVLLTPARPVGLDLRHVVAVWVDPVHVRDLQLIDVVSGLCDDLGVALRIRRRTMIEPDRRAVWADIVAFLRDGEKPLVQLLNRADASVAFRTWAAEMQASDRSWIWERFARHLVQGTVRYLAVARAAGAPIDEDRGFWSKSRRSGTLVAGSVLAPASAEAVRACGHLIQPGDGGTCYACIGRSRSAWRYDD